MGQARRLRFLLRSLWYYRSSTDWFGFVRTSHLSKHLGRHEDILQQVHRPYYDYRMSSCRKVSLLMEHHKLLAWLLGEERLHDLFRWGRLELCTLTGKDGGVYAVDLTPCDAQLNKEGQLSLCLSHGSRRLLYLTFSLGKGATGGKMLIGGIQATPGDTIERLRHATSELHEVQPRLLLVNILRMIAERAGIVEIEAVSSRNHVYRSKRYRRKKGAFPAYDALWEMLEGTPLACGNYRIPAALPRKPIDEYPSRKRSAQRKKKQLLDEADRQVTLFFDAHLPGRFPALPARSRCKASRYPHASIPARIREAEPLSA